MLSVAVKKKLQTLRDLPAIPTVISQLLHSLDNVDIPAAHIAKLIERDQALTSKILQAANSPFYGFSRKISTIELAVVIMGFNSIKEIVISLVIQKFVKRYSRSLIDINQFWDYSVFCGAAARLLARRLGYRLAGEAFVAGLMHDMGVLILVQNFTNDFRTIKALQEDGKISLVAAEEIVLGCTHADIGAWLAEKWNLPEQLVNSIQYHHTPYSAAMKMQEIAEKSKQQNRFTQDELSISATGKSTRNNSIDSQEPPLLPSKSKYSKGKNVDNATAVSNKFAPKIDSNKANSTKNGRGFNNKTRIKGDVTKDKNKKTEAEQFLNFSEIKQPLTAIVSMSEWFAETLGFKVWSGDRNRTKLFLASEIFEELTQNDLLDAGSAIGKLKQEILLEYERASEINKIPAKSLY